MIGLADEHHSGMVAICTAQRRLLRTGQSGPVGPRIGLRRPYGRAVVLDSHPITPYRSYLFRTARWAQVSAAFHEKLQMIENYMFGLE